MTIVFISYWLNNSYGYFSCGNEHTYCLSGSTPRKASGVGPKQIASPEVTYVFTQGKNTEMKDLELCILKHWIHSHEEDSQSNEVYRPADYNFPPSRGRVGFEFQEGGKLVYYGIGRADGSEQSSGHWLIEKPNRIKINVDNGRIQPFVLNVTSCNDQMLVVKK